MKAQKKGFTLIELMVVIVIIGILAAIAIPKLFGMSAKAKAQEVPGAAGTWTKLQSAYVIEKDEMGTPTSISYLLPGLTAASNIGTVTGFNYNVATNTWSAKAKQDLNDCKSTEGWDVTMAMSAVSNATAATNCLTLTPNFYKLK